MVCWVGIMKKRVFGLLYYSSSKRLVVQGKKGMASSPYQV